MSAVGLISCVGAVALGCFISLDRPSGTGPRDGAVLHGVLAGLAFIAVLALQPMARYVEDVVLFAGMAAVLVAPFVLKRAHQTMRAAGHQALVPADQVTVISAIWGGAALATGSAKAIVFVLLVAALAATMKSRAAAKGADAIQAPSRRVELHNTMAVLIEKLNSAQNVLREEEARAPVLRMPARLIVAETQVERAPMVARRRETRASPRVMPRRVVPASRGPLLARA